MLLTYCFVVHSGGDTAVAGATGVEFRLVAVPEMGYDPSAEPPSGELCIRGPGVFSGYYKQPELTKECMGEQLEAAERRYQAQLE